MLLSGDPALVVDANFSGYDSASEGAEMTSLRVQVANVSWMQPPWNWDWSGKTVVFSLSGTATPGQDYEVWESINGNLQRIDNGSTATFQFPAAAAYWGFYVKPLRDGAIEDPESVIVTATSGATGTRTLTINDTPPSLVSLSVSDKYDNETATDDGSGGTHSVNVTQSALNHGDIHIVGITDPSPSNAAVYIVTDPYGQQVSTGGIGSGVDVSLDSGPGTYLAMGGIDLNRNGALDANEVTRQVQAQVKQFDLEFSSTDQGWDQNHQTLTVTRPAQGQVNKLVTIRVLSKGHPIPNIPLQFNPSDPDHGTGIATNWADGEQAISDADGYTHVKISVWSSTNPQSYTVTVNVTGNLQNKKTFTVKVN